MKTTDIPNGYVVLGPSGGNILVDYDDNGKAQDEATNVNLAGWPETIMVENKVLPEVIVLVHTVKGSEHMLVKRLAARAMELDGKPMTIAEMARKGVLNHKANDIWKEYMEYMKKQEVIAKGKGKKA